MKLLIFNPDTDFALASGSLFYTPPAAALKLMEVDPAFAGRWGTREDSILFLGRPLVMPAYRSSTLPAWEEGRNEGLIIPAATMADWEEGKKEAFWSRITEIDPWGWNPALRQRLLGLGAPARLLPSQERMDTLRELAHRRTTILFNTLAGEPRPTEIFTEKDALAFRRRNPGCWMKAPWSSSGRGVMNTAGLTDRQVEEWARGTIRRQGSLLAETGWEKVGDFASEWMIKKGKARLLGLSGFKTSSRGRYLGQSSLRQQELRHELAASIQWGESRIAEVLQKQKEGLETIIAPGYEGPVGIDMLADSSGELHACVEINLRRTMGMLAIRD